MKCSACEILQKCKSFIANIFTVWSVSKYARAKKSETLNSEAMLGLTVFQTSWSANLWRRDSASTSSVSVSVHQGGGREEEEEEEEILM